MAKAKRSTPATSSAAQHEELAFSNREGAVALRLLALTRDSGQNGLVFISGGEARIERIAHILWALAPDIEAIVFPPWDCMPYDRAPPSARTMGLRVAALSRLVAGPERPWVVLTTSEGLMQRVPPRDLWDSSTLSVSLSKQLDLDHLRSELIRIGYREDDRVDEAGEFAIRGQVLDVFPAGYALPVRVEHEEGRVSSIASFDAASQLRTDEFETLTVRPVSEAVTSERDGVAAGQLEHRLSDLYARLDTLLDYTPAARLAFEPRAKDRGLAFLEQIQDAFDSRTRLDLRQARPFPPDRLYLSDDELTQRLEAHPRITFVERDGQDPSAIPNFAAAARPAEALGAFLQDQRQKGRRIVAAASSEPRMRSLARVLGRALGQGPHPVLTWDEVTGAEPGAVLSMPVSFTDGFLLEEEAAVVVTPADLLGSRALGSSANEAANPFSGDEEFRIGDAVIHLDHGVGLLEGIETIGPDPDGATDTIRLEYAGGSKLMVPTADIGLMWRYGAAAGVALDRLGGDAWPKRRAKVEAEINKAAIELARLAGERHALERPPINPPRRLYERFVARFPFTETADQNAAVHDILKDLASGHVMDRLVCGDVGFGKTEVALRAAAAVALSGQQVAVVAPTTVLVRQHLHTFRRRFADLGIEVDHLSRLVKPAAAKVVKARLSEGRVRVVVGTHALAGKGVCFADLGLLIVDEEQRFGAAHKERLRALGEAVHVLTLTATPIPRTMQSALVGLQDVSVLATPPAERQPVRTYVMAFDDVTVREALLREKRRGGQSFVVCPRIEDIEPMSARLRALVPELEVFSAHGKLPADEIDETMIRFADGEGDVLLATNIIESGLDVPRANTILIWRAEIFGLSQLHQLRGRVGRGRPRGFAYLLTEPDTELKDETRNRLATLERLDRLGSGFAISAEDLDQRGAGDLLGEAQAGHLKLIGAGLYRRLLERALLAARGRIPPEEWTPELNVELAGRIPAEYVPEPEVRLNLYAKVARCTDRRSESQIADEIEDRFGPVPEEVTSLLALTRLKRLCRSVGVSRVDAGPQAIALTFKERRDSDHALEALAARDDLLTWRGGRLIYNLAIAEPRERLQVLESLLERLPST